MPLLHTKGEIRTPNGNRPNLSPALNHTWLVHSDSRVRSRDHSRKGKDGVASAFFLLVSQGRLTKTIIPSAAPSSAYMKVLLIPSSGSQRVIRGYLGVPETFSVRLQGQNYFQNNTHTFFLVSFMLILSGVSRGVSRGYMMCDMATVQKQIEESS